MRKILLTIALMGTLMCNAQKGENFYDKIKVDVSAGYATKGFLAGNVGVSIDNSLTFRLILIPQQGAEGIRVL